MTVADEAPALAAPPRPPPHTPAFHLLLRARSSWLESFGADAYDEPVLERRLLWRRNLVVSDPAAIRRVLLDNAANYSKTNVARRLLEPGLGKGLITLEGDAWRRHRRIMAPAFDHQSIVAAVPAMVEAADWLAAQWEALPPGRIIDMAQEMRRLTLRIIARTMFSTDSSGMEALVGSSVARYQESLRPSLLDLAGLPDFWPRLRNRRGRAAFAELSAQIDRIIDGRRGEPQGSRVDLLARLIASTDEDGALSPEDIRAEVLTIFMAGHETTALALTWAWYLLAAHPAAQARLEAELEEALGGRPLAHGDLERLVFTRMALDETLRLYPPAHTMSRQALGPDELCGRRVRKGSIVFILPWLVHRHRRLWDEPDCFIPDRFAPERAESRPRYAYLPFGAGPRVCIGAAFAVTEAMSVLATLARRFRPRLAPGHTVETAGLITLRPKNGLMMILERR